ncbi:MAG: aldo/keto reductase [Firmicutes bacterium]|nr:aldo/keto reductase [Bacillota bacterium]
MKKIQLGNTGIFVTPIGFGVLTIGNTQLNLTLEEGAKVVRYAYDHGINFFDTAQYYETYKYMREAFAGIDMSPENPDRPIIASKCLDSSYEEMEFAIKECMDEIGLEIIDIFLLHEVRSDPDFDNRSGAWQCLKDYKAKGIIKAIGVSTHYVDVTERMACEPDCDIVFPLINYAGLGIRNGSEAGTSEEMASAIDKCIKAGKGLMGMKAFGGGNLTGTYQKALNYVIGLGVHTLMIGMGKTSEVDDIISFAEGTMPADYQPEVKNKKIHIDQGDCEACYTCKERCPNQAIFINESGLCDINYHVCLNCGYCAPVCPVRAIIMW